MEVSEQIKAKLLQLYDDAKKIKLEGKGGGWVNQATYALEVNRAKINYKGSKGCGKLTGFLINSGLFDIVTVGCNYIREKNYPDISSLKEDADLIDIEIPERIEQLNDDNNLTKQLSIFEQEDQGFIQNTLSLEPHDISSVSSQIDETKLLLFNKLKAAKQMDWDTFSKPDYIGIWKSVIEKYPETAHFIYELIQNADDALATETAIVLYKDKLVFKHNGKKQFSLTDANNHDTMMGDINSITSVACSTKKDEEQTIGKFGVGFKSVFQYTDAPCIYDDTFWFRIDNYIIPSLLESDHELRYEGETLFEIPFKNPEKAYNEIYSRLINLRMPVLFLPHVQRIVWKIDGEQDFHIYSKEVLQSNERYGITYELCRINDYQKKLFLYLFKRDYKTSQGSYPISVVYYINPNDKGSLNTDAKSSVYCFFPTREKFDSCFVCHAPFLLTDNRDGIKSFEKVNTEFLQGIAQLAADALLCLKEIGIHRTPRLEELFEDNRRELSYKADLLLINDNIFKLTNIKSTEERDIFLKNCFLNIIKNYDIILTRSNQYVNRDKALVTTGDLESLINSNQIKKLCNNDNIDFIFIKKYRLDIRELTGTIGILTFDNEKLADKLTKFFMLNQNPEWIDRLLNYIEENARTLWVPKDNSERKCREPRGGNWWYSSHQTIPGEDSWSNLKFRFAPIVKTSKGDWVSPYTLYKKGANVILPFTAFEDVDSSVFGVVIDKDLYNQHKDFYKKLGLTRPSMLDYVEKGLLARYSKIEGPGDAIIKKDFDFIYNLLNSTSRCDNNILNCLRERWLIRSDFNTYKVMSHINQIAIPNERFIKFMGLSNNFRFIDIEFYAAGTNHTVAEIETFFVKFFSIPNKPKIIEKKYITESQSYAYTGKTYSYNNFPQCAKDFLLGRSLAVTNPPRYTDYYLEGYKTDNITKEWSHILWNYVTEYGFSGYSKASLYYYVYRARDPHYTEFDSTYLSSLKNDKWIAKEDGVFCSPKEISSEEFHNLGYERNDKIEETLGFWDYIKDDVEEKERLEKLEFEKAERDDLIKQALDSGVDVNGLLRNALSNNSYSTSYVSVSNKEAINTIVDNLNDEEINQLAESIKEGGFSTLIQSQDIPQIITNNIDSLTDITKAVGEENLPIVAEHVGEFVDWMFDEEYSPSMVRRIVSYIGKKIYEYYLINEDIAYESLANDSSDCDYYLNDGKYVRVISTLKSIVDYKIPIGLSAAQNAFLKHHPDKEIRIIRISFKDISVLPQYTRIIELYGKEEDPAYNEKLCKMCDNLAKNYWNGVDIEEFDNASPEYSIKIERKN